ncbi:MAG: GumC domain-containing protein, partial [Planctomycetota bacterium]
METPFPQLQGKGEDVTGIAASDDGARYELVTEAGTDYPAESPILWLRRLLRGRYRLAIGLAALAGCLGALAGFLALPAKYESQGLVRIEKALPAILYPTQEGQAQPDFDAYVAAQVAHLQSRSVAEAAAGSPAMVQAGWPAGPAGVTSLHQALEVRRPRGEHFLFVAVGHKDPRLAHIAVNAVLDAYRDRPREAEGLTFAAREQALVLREESLHNALFLLRTQILEASGQYGREAIDRMHAARVEELIEIDRKLGEVRMERERLLAGEGAALVPASGIFPTGADRLSDLKQRELALLAEIKGSRYRPGHPVLQELARRLETVRIQMDLYGRAGRTLTTEGDQTPADATALADLARLEASYEAARTPIRQDAEKLGRLRVTLSGLGEHEAQLKERLSLARQRLDEIRFEAGRGNTDRISIVRGELPVAPVSDRRRGLAAA